MPINNEVYSTQPNAWWDENHYLHLLKTGINPARYGYFEEILTKQMGLTLKNLKVLDVGCGGGILSEEFARAGCQVTGVDPAEPSLEVARQHAQSENLNINYQFGTGENIPFNDAVFDVVVCCDVLEHVNDVEKVTQELLRVVKPGGVVFFDTINRTAKSYLANIFIAQQFPLTSFFDADVHVWHQFITPEELTGYLQKSGLQVKDLNGLTSALPDVLVAILLVLRKFGFLNQAELGRKLKFRVGGGLSTNYIGWGVKKA